MSISDSIAPHLPFLRRFARTLTGSQDAGDAYVVTLLESIVAEPKSFPTDVEPKIALYRSFLRLWNAVELNREADVTVDVREPGGSGLNSITPIPRQVFLLTSVEGFTSWQAALIMNVTLATINDLLGQAGQEIVLELTTDVLIIEDEPLIAFDLESLVQSLGHRVTGIARTHREAVAAVKNQRPGLVLADIQLADGSSGLEAVNEILQEYAVPVIFITAFPERLLTGERPEPTFLLSKPFEDKTIRAVISQALFFGMKASQRAARTKLPESHKK